ncbi:lipopolysaccharide transport periplasmic protein LptA [Pseudoruegeria sp. HB172150]|uniref:lipopolysaccharide transport periplasmic protein LptA n=1 Tax=Pseudoruegeria sp. HB172150 TaxID=2721164 RepID=UPI001553DDF2|nr:lipopolysaccharide transport periplasmic protein LptA [Pseudoruegeria sp. HB172150]
MIAAARISAALVSLALLLTPPALAQGTSVSLGIEGHDSTQPVEITSEQLSVNQQSGQAEFTGNVIVGQGDLVMTCERMLVEYGSGDGGNNEIRLIRMFGGVTFVGSSEAAEADEAVYTLAEDTIVLTGNVLVTQGATAISGNQLTYNLQSGSGAVSGNVKTVLNPGQN